jgi:hypothetical protein
MKTKEQVEKRLQALLGEVTPDLSDVRLLMKAQEMRVLGWVLKDEE